MIVNLLTIYIYIIFYAYSTSELFVWLIDVYNSIRVSRTASLFLKKKIYFMTAVFGMELEWMS